MSSENVLKRLLKEKTENKVLEKYLRPEPILKKKATKAPGRPKISDDLKARNFTLCLAPQYLQFLDRMIVKDTKIQGRGRKIRFIIERFIEHEKRSISQIKVLREALGGVQETLRGFSGQLKKGQKQDLNIKEKAVISQAVNQVHTLIKILHYSPKTLQRILPREEWAILSFCLDWKNNRELKF